MKDVTLEGEVKGQTRPSIVRQEAHPSWRYALVGVAVGIAVLALSAVVREFVVEPWTCRSADAFSMCSNAGALAFNVATVFGAVIGTVFMVKLLAFRPLLVAIAGAVTLWGLQGLIGTFAWYEALVWVAGLYGITYWVYGWVLRLHHFPVALLLAIVVAFAARVALNA